MLRTISLLAASAALVSAQSVLNTPADIYSCVTAAFPYTCEDTSGCSVIFRDFNTNIQLASITSIPTGSGTVSWVPNVAKGTIIMGVLTASSTGSTFPTAQLTVEEQLGASNCALSAAVISTYGGAATTAGGSPAATGAGSTTDASSASSRSSSAASGASSASSAASSTASSAASSASSRSSSAASEASSASSNVASSASSVASSASSAAARPTESPASGAAGLQATSFIAGSLLAGLALFA